MMSWLMVFALVAVGLTTVAQAQQVCRADIGFIVDESGSIRDTNPRGVENGSPDDNWVKQIRFIEDVVKSLDISPDGTRVGLTTFSNNGRLHFDFNEYTNNADVEDRIRNLPYRGGHTNTTGGLKVGKEFMFSERGGDRADADNLMILLSDGNPTRDVDELFPYAARLRDEFNIRIIGIGVTTAVNETIFREIVSKNFTDHYFPVTNFDTLKDIIADLINEACKTRAPVSTTPAPPSNCKNQADVVFTLDSSGSIKSSNYKIAKEFTKTLVSGLDIDSNRIQFGMLQFSGDVEMEMEMERHSRQEVMDMVDDMKYLRGPTNTARALQYIRENVLNNRRDDRDEAKNIVVILTDGNSNDKAATVEQAYLAKKAGIHLITIAVGNWYSSDELDTIASFPASVNSIKVSTFSDLEDIVADLTDMICDNVDDCRDDPCENGGTCVDGIGIYWCQCPEGFAGVNCERTCRMPSDLSIAVDASGSVRLENFRATLEFIRNVVYGVNLPQSRVSLLTFGSDASVRFTLEEYEDRSRIMDAIGTLHYLNKATTRTDRGLELMADDVFGGRTGDRSNVQNVGLVVTDGKSDIAEDTWQNAMKVRNEQEAFMVVVGVGSNIRPLELEGIASEPIESNVVLIDQFQQFNDIQTNIIDSVCNEVNDCSERPCENGGTCVDLLGGYKCECPLAWTGPNCVFEDNGRVDIAFVIDSSGSIRRSRYIMLKEMIAQGIEQYLEIRNGKTQVGAIRWSEEAIVEFYLNTYQARQDVAAAIRRMEFMKGRTHTSDALELLKTEIFNRRNGDREDARNVAFVFTDGNSNMEAELTVQKAIEAQIAGVQIIVIAVGENLNQLELMGIASNPDRVNYFAIPTIDEIPNVIGDVFRAHLNQVDECDRARCDRGTCVDGVGFAHCECDRSYIGVECDTRCNEQMDIALILDLSGSLDSVVDNVIETARQLIQRLPVASDRANVALVTFHDEALIRFDLDTYDTSRELLIALQFGNYGGKTNTYDALVKLDDVFDSRKGDRNGIDNKAVLITDGKSNVNERRTVDEADRVKRNKDVEMYVIAIGEGPDMAEINGIASDPDGEHVFTVAGPQDIPDATERLSEILCGN